ncbi:MAG TPA: hypothetical protein PKW08_10350 [Flavobacteriaceae bacterium]|nr:hypothetical protein [Flavobacteriaceae bacterium]HQU21976.1 hypothetical protein [Flavobacteriaceae bacterium]HQU64330.1 hypothetical protein [Flavobacteriaceae bacterium]HRW43206.1 hypothetical protein [Flavobacteriaceae bacterium]
MMKNKALAFDYIQELLYQNPDADLAAEKDPQLEEDDRKELGDILGTIRLLFDKAEAYKQSTDEQMQELERVQLETTKKAFQYNTQNIENTYQTIMSIKTSLQNVVKDASRAYNYIMIMYITVFVLGVGLIVTSIVFAAQDKTILAIAFGAVGFIDLVTTFFFKPPLEIQNSRSNLTQLMIIITNWFAELMNLNTYISTRGDKIELDEMMKVGKTLNNSTREMIELIEKYGEIRK